MTGVRRNTWREKTSYIKRLNINIWILLTFFISLSKHILRKKGYFIFTTKMKLFSNVPRKSEGTLPLENLPVGIPPGKSFP